MAGEQLALAVELEPENDRAAPLPAGRLIGGPNEVGPFGQRTPQAAKTYQRATELRESRL
jgi:hypothetical protein